MGVDVGGGGKGGVSQPLLDLLHGNTLTEQQTGAAMAQIMEPDVPQAMLLQQEFEMVGDVVGPEQFAHLVGAHIVQVVGAVGLLEQFPVLLLPGTLLLQQNPHRRDQRQRAETGLGFQLVLGVEPDLTVHDALGDLVVDGQGAFLKVDGAPADAQHLAAPQAIVTAFLICVLSALRLCVWLFDNCDI